MMMRVHSIPAALPQDRLGAWAERMKDTRRENARAVGAVAVGLAQPRPGDFGAAVGQAERQHDAERQHEARAPAPPTTVFAFRFWGLVSQGLEFPSSLRFGHDRECPGNPKGRARNRSSSRSSKVSTTRLDHSLGIQCGIPENSPSLDADARATVASRCLHQPQYRFAFRSRLVSRSFQVRFGRSRVQTTRTGHVAFQNTLHRTLEPRHQSTTTLKHQRNSKSIPWLDAGRCVATGAIMPEARTAAIALHSTWLTMPAPIVATHTNKST